MGKQSLVSKSLQTFILQYYRQNGAQRWTDAISFPPFAHFPRACVFTLLLRSFQPSRVLKVTPSNPHVAL